ncbi:hypothetical protein BDN72DRAFT_963551 [Pluteus cervinus]|uniref:Uncharacterized protein n=1 Tax=Pluteus cervinus TaxID=181527 RepID=A0ACD3AED5_9AGAR|nr:hypothetical protein BDN72DRAFT_963551 [Pluteus cervinus]
MSKPSIPGMGHPSTPGNPNKRPRTGSAAHLVLTGDDRPIRTIEKFMAEWNEYEDYQKVDSEVFKAADKELKSLKKLREYREEHEDEDVDVRLSSNRPSSQLTSFPSPLKAVALSSLERKHLSRMNVKTCKDAVSIDTWESLTVDQFDSDTDRAITYQQIDECWEQGKDQSRTS